MDALILDTKNTFMMNEFVIIELFHLLIKKKGKEGYEIGSELINGKYPFFEIKYDLLQVSDLEGGLKIFGDYGYTTTIGGRDSTILYTMKCHSITEIITNDQGFQTVKYIHCHDPLEKKDK